MQDTRVFELSSQAGHQLEERLRAELPPDAEWRPAPHAIFWVRSGGVVATLYASGKLVLQGTGLDLFAARFLGRQVEKRDASLPFDVVTIGSDESGKGDYFGPLVVAAVLAGPEVAPELASLRVADSKTLSDAKVQSLAGLLEQRYQHHVVSVMPSAYNPMYREVGNLNVLLARLHAQAIGALLHAGQRCGRVLVDKFGDESLILGELRRHHQGLPEIVQVPRAEAHPVVAAASILARARFLGDLRQCEQSCATDLPKGGGADVDAAGGRVLSIGGRELLSQVAKLHFKNTARLSGRGADR